MNKATLEDYASAIKHHYNLVKMQDSSGLLLNPTPANLKKACCNYLEIRNSKNDRGVFKDFFNLNQEGNLRKQIEKTDSDRLRPVQYFLIGRTDNPQQAVLELIAVLIDFTPRPFISFFRGGNFDEDASDNSIEVEEEKTKNIVEEGLKNDSNDYFNRKRVMVVFWFIGLIFLGYIIKKELFPSKECMQWNNDHYEEVVCEGNKLGFANINPIFDKDEDLLNFRKIEVNDTTTFFKNSQPIVWYIKIDNKCEYFNSPGLHPITNKPLRPITQYIVDKYVLRERDTIVSD